MTGSPCRLAHVIDGPAVLEQPDATIFVEPWLQARVDEFGNILIERKERG
jgi:N-methylhydantoinase A